MRAALVNIGAVVVIVAAVLAFMRVIGADNPARPVQSCQLGWTGQLKPGPCADYNLPGHHKRGQ